MRTQLNLLLLTLGLVFFSACSTVMNSTSQEIYLKSNPPNANITIDNVPNASVHELYKCIQLE